MSKKKRKENLRDQIANMFEKAGYIVEVERFDDGSSSWLNIFKKDKPNIKLELSFNFEGTKFTDFDVWRDILEVVDSEKIL